MMLQKPVILGIRESLSRWYSPNLFLPKLHHGEKNPPTLYDMDPQLFTTHRRPYCNSRMQTETYEIGDFVEMESMQFVSPHEINPIIQNMPIQSVSVPSQVSFKSNITPEIGDITQNNNIKLKMEEFSDLSTLVSGAKIDLTGATDELSTPVFDKDAFDFTSYPSIKSYGDNSDLKVKVEYNAQYYSCDKNMYKDLTLSIDNQAKNKENYSISRVSNEQSEMNLYQSFAHNICCKDKLDDVCSPPYQDLHLFDNTDAYNETSFSSNLSVNNIKYSNSTVSSPQEDRYSFISSPGNDQQTDIPTLRDNDQSYETKPKVNLMTDQFKFSIKSEGPLVLNTPDVIEEVVNMGTDFNILDLVDNEDITILSADEELLLSLASPSTPSLPPTPSTTSSKPSSPVKKSRRRKLSNDNEEADYIPQAKRRSTVRLTDIDIEDNSSDDSDYGTKTPARKTKLRGRPPKSADSVSSNCSKNINLSKYRELRDKNNEASRKSRLKRRLKEIEYEQEAEELQSKNVRLKAQVEELEKMVSTFRNNLFKILVNK